MEATIVRDAGSAEAEWRPVPFRQFVLKIHSRCDLACSHCYMYTAADQGWRDQPRVMSPRTVAATAARIGEHIAAHGLTGVRVILHGGEPLLAGGERIAEVVRSVRENAGAPVSFHLQTNGTLLTGPLLDTLDDLDVRIGVSLDGDAAAHDRLRRHADGRGSHARVAEGIALLNGRHRRLFGGLLCTVDLRNDPVAVYEALLAHDPPEIDFLLPHGTWSAPPPGLPSAGTPYAAWLLRAFDAWRTRPVTEVRMFRDLLHLLLGGRTSTEGLGLAPVAVAVVETDGSIEQSDILKIAFQGASGTGLHVATDPFDAALPLPSVRARQTGLGALCEQCRACPVVRVCGGGLYAHRYRAGSGFANPSVYCDDLYALITSVRGRLTDDLTRIGSHA
ncbi:FxsB family cyclophane-forming radical SAM/SPASM peptide maturase [Actinocorallia longicatena]|uniref:FxsB family radical SAM/SPASM domain protein n=1 Tax=Actinocorallia longicatena TaxID=111803 RepID=A0ABP6Q0Q5_9ACTN